MWFFEVVCGQGISHSLFATHPYHLTPREMTLGDTTTLSTDLGSCWIAKTEFGEYPFHPLGEYIRNRSAEGMSYK